MRPLALVLVLLTFSVHGRADSEVGAGGTELTDTCWDCGYLCAHPDYHNDEEGGVFLGFSAGWHINYCHWSNCYAYHNFDCYGSLNEEDLDDLESLIENHHYTALSLTIAGSSKITFDSSRSAVQVRGCNGGIVASYPIGSDAGIRISSLLRTSSLVD